MESQAGLAELLARYAIPPDSDSARKFRAYVALIEKWGSRIRLTSSARWPTLGPLFEEAVWAARIYPTRASDHLDIGSGAGFPALPLAILHPELTVHLVEARERRAVFLESATAELRMTNVRVHAERLDAFLRRDSGEVWESASWKALRLEGRQLEALLARKPRELWIFHGRTLPASEPVLLAAYGLAERLAVPDRLASYLSVYHRQQT
jgi:hypothetical protein